MKVVEKQMVDAINERKSKKLGGVHPSLGVNTEVRYDKDDGCSAVFLFGNHIADYWYGKANPVEVNIDTLARWPTATTKSRLRALGVKIRTVRGTMFVNGWELGV